LLTAPNMPTVAENLQRWQHFPWEQQGDEWSPGSCPEGTRLLWLRTILPRLDRFVPTGTILEIAPGFGRWTQYLRRLSDRLIVVDVSPRCVEACRARFAGDRHISYHVNDGRSLAMIADESVDLIFSFDSLVHVEADVLDAYLSGAARILKPGGAGFIHHSNLGEFVNPRTGRLPAWVRPTNWRAESMSADVFRAQCAAAGLSCRSQELLNWIGRGASANRHRVDGRLLPLTDCISVFMRATADGPAHVIRNDGFVDEWRTTVSIVDAYAREPNTNCGPTPPTRSILGRKLGTAAKAWRQESVRGITSIARRHAANAAEKWRVVIASWIRGHLIRWFPRGFLGR
jgi:SAM-dependent methyltransferase